MSVEAVPLFEITPEARTMGISAVFDRERYYDYLVGRNVSESEIKRLKIMISKPTKHPGLNAFFLRGGKNEDSHHTIGFPANRVPYGRYDQSRVLRHETEHFIYSIDHPHMYVYRYAVALGSMAFGAAFFSKYGFERGVEISSEWGESASVTASALGVYVGGMAGSALGFIGGVAALDLVAPTEFFAHRAEKVQPGSLPNGVLLTLRS